ncbi:MAG: twin-arginine translocase TatA/TatE family subunit [Coriobacteriales bacterium]|nr:twin-arginine translocase TatA/TatE family subunit [Coriobacteriales bacterium]
MRVFGMGMPELIIILLVILIIFGPKNLPKLGSALGRAVKGVREGVEGVSDELEGATDTGAAGSPSKPRAAVTATATVEDMDDSGFNPVDAATGGKRKKSAKASKH